MTQSIPPSGDRSLSSTKNQPTSLVRVPPKASPTLIEKWIVWELKGCVDTKGVRLDTTRLHDLLKAKLQEQRVPVNIFYADDVTWIVPGIDRTIKFSSDRRPRVVVTLDKDTPFTNIQFIAGIDYFGNSNWADIQMMLISQPEGEEEEEKEPPPKTSDFGTLKVALIAVFIFVILPMMFSGNNILIFFSLLGLGGIIYLALPILEAFLENQDKIFEYESKISQRERKKRERQREREENILLRLCRSFKTDDLRMFHAVMVETVHQIIKEELISHQAEITEIIVTNDSQSAIPDRKDILDNF